MPLLASTTALDPALSMARQALYRFAALSLLDPKCGSWEQLDALRDDPVVDRGGRISPRTSRGGTRPRGLG